jgi:hypothetical protein|tara:strand:- start:8162 stop:8464 length:303 start_codon:yes stop_codon:yes gene_type:complete
MSGFQLQSLDIEDISRAAKQNVKSDTRYDAGTITDTNAPLKGVTSKQRARSSEIADILDIGAGTRCTHCGMLHFLWRATCGACDRPMDYNLGERNEEARY